MYFPHWADRQTQLRPLKTITFCRNQSLNRRQTVHSRFNLSFLGRSKAPNVDEHESATRSI